MRARSGLSRRALVIATGALAITSTTEARKKGKRKRKRNPPPPPALLAFAVVTVTGIQPTLDLEQISCATQGSFHHPASGQVGNFDPAVEFAFETPAEEVSAKIIATVRQVIVEELASKGQVVAADLIAVTVV